MSPDDLRQQIELQVVEFIKAKLAGGTITDERAQQISQKVLDLLKPGMSFEELYKAIPKLDDTISELSPIVVPYVREYEERVVKHAQKGVQKLIREGQFDAATKLAHQAVNQEVKLQWEGSAGAPPKSQILHNTSCPQ